MPSRLPALLLAASLLGAGAAPAVEQAPGGVGLQVDPLLGPRSRLPRDWIGRSRVAPDTPILVMAGHADSQNVAGPGTRGEAVALRGARPMYPGITDELYWNIVVAEEVVRLGRQRGLAIAYHQPPFRNIRDGDAPGTNWSAGAAHAARGGYALEIHFDAYGPDGVGSGLIPAMHRPFTLIDESLARAFGGYPMRFRQVLGGPRRGISLLEVGKLEGRLEASLRDPALRAATVRTIATRIVDALEMGLGRRSAPTALTSPPRTVGSAPPESDPRASSGGG